MSRRVIFKNIPVYSNSYDMLEDVPIEELKLDIKKSEKKGCLTAFFDFLWFFRF